MKKKKESVMTSEWFKQQMKDLGLTQKQVVEHSGLSQPVLSEILNDYKGKDYRTAKIALKYYFFWMKSILLNESVSRS